MDYTIEELREMAELTNSIVANLKQIEDCALTDDDFSEMAQTTSTITTNLCYIAENSDDCELDAALEKTNAIVANLQAIEESE